MKRIPLEGTIIGDTEVIEYVGDRQYMCRCTKCGKIFIASSSGLHKGYNTKCKSVDNLIGKVFGEWKVTRYAGNGKYECICSCGKVGLVGKHDLLCGNSTSCGHNRLIDLTGKTIGDWEVLKYLGNKKYLCKCTCGVIREVFGESLRNGDSTSCGHDKPQEDLTGKVFGDWSVLRYAGHGKWECQCSCGNTSLVGGFQLRNGDSTSCGHKLKFIDLTGKQFGDLKVEKYLGNGKWECRCSCGEVVVRDGKSIRRGDTLSCGHLKSFKMSVAARGNGTDEQIAAVQNVGALLKFIPDINECTYLDVANRLGLKYSTTVRLVNKFKISDLLKSCKPHYKEDELANFIESVVGDGNVVRNDRTVIGSKELDIYIPSKKVAIEFNGTYWHSYPLKDKEYHQDKTLECAKNGVRLIHIFEYEWDDEDAQNKIKCYLRDLLQNTNVIYARNTEIKEVPVKDSVLFQTENHLQGASSASVHIGTYYNNELVGIMTLGKPRFNSEYQYEIIRMCFKHGIRVIGGAEKMFKYFIKAYNPINVLTYSDISKFTGNIYLRLGFNIIQSQPLTEPNYVWVNPVENIILKRYQTQKQKLIDMGYSGFGNTEDEIMESLGYIKVYDCGSIRLEYVGKGGI